MQRALIAIVFIFAVALFVPRSGTGAVEKHEGPSILVANQGDRSLSIIDSHAATKVAAVPEGGITGHEVITSADGRLAYVPMYGSSGVGKPGTDGSTMVVIDVMQHKVVNTLDFGHGVRPHCPVLNPKDGMLYVTTELDQTVTVIDPKTLKIVGSVPTGQIESHMLAISHGGRLAYTSNVGPGTVSVLDLKARTHLATIPISKNSQRISISMDDSMVFTSDQTKPQLAVIDTKTNKVKAWVPLPGTGYGTAPTLDGLHLLVCIPHENKIAVVDLATLKVSQTVDLPSAPQEVLVRPDGKVAYVSCNSSAKVAVINLTNFAVEKLIDAGKGADGLAWSRAAMSAGM